jgi:hypothetical protein
MCPRWESNPHPLRDTILSRARIPVPPLGQLKYINIFKTTIPERRPPRLARIKTKAV